MRYFAVVTYSGTKYDGWQIQIKRPTVEKAIEDVLKHILGQEISIVASGRTDKGVHAYGQTFHFDVPNEINNVGKFLYSLNRLLPEDIKVLSLTPVSDDFHARFSAIGKRYEYHIYLGKMVPFYLDNSAISYVDLDIEAMKEASYAFIGEHNFQNFTSKEEDDWNFIRTITSLDINKDKDLITISIEGNGFMRYMVRYIVGELIEAGKHKTNKEKLIEMIDKTPRTVTNHKAPAEGLYLAEVYYGK